MNCNDKLKELNITLPEPAKPVAAYVPAIQSGDFVYTSGQLPSIDGKLYATGKLGAEVDEETGYQAARISAINCLAAVKSVIGDLNDIEQIVKVVGFVNSAPGFTGQPKVINGASELFAQVFGAAGEHARSAVGVSELPLNSPVEVEIVVRVKNKAAKS